MSAYRKIIPVTINVLLLTLVFKGIAFGDPVCTDIQEVVPTGGVTRGDRQNVDVNVNIALGDYYCAAPSAPTMNDMESDPCASKDITPEESLACTYHQKSGANCPVSGSPEFNAVKEKIMADIKSQIGERPITADSNKNTNVKNEAAFHQATITKLRTPAEARSPSFVSQTSGTASKMTGLQKVYFAACVNLVFPSDWNIPPETGWFTMAQTQQPAKGVVPPSFKNDQTNVTANQERITKLPGSPAIIEALKRETPSFSSDVTNQKDFPKIELKLASERLGKDKYAVYWRLCTAKGVDSCGISNFVADIEDSLTKQSVVATTPTSVWGYGTGNPMTSGYQCFTTGDFGTHPIQVNAPDGSSYPFTAKIIGQSDEEIQLGPNPPAESTPHCQNNAQVSNAIYLGPTTSYSGSGQFATVAYCPEGDYVSPTGVDAKKQGVCINGICRLSTITRLWNAAKNAIANTFEQWTKKESPPIERASCQGTVDYWCHTGMEAQKSRSLEIKQTVTPGDIAVDSGDQYVEVELQIFNTSTRDAEGVWVQSQWNPTDRVKSIDDHGAGGGQRSGYISWYFPTLAVNDAANPTPTIIRYTATIDTNGLSFAQRVLQLRSWVNANVIYPTEETATIDNVAIRVGVRDTIPASTKSDSPNGLSITQSSIPTTFSISASPPIGTATITTRISSNRYKVDSGTVTSHWNQNDLTPEDTQWSFNDPANPLQPGVFRDYSYTVSVPTEENALFTGQATVKAVLEIPANEGASVNQVAIRISSARSACEALVWWLCYVQGVSNTILSKRYVQTIPVHIYPYSDIAYTQQIETAVASPTDGYANAFTPPNDEQDKRSSKVAGALTTNTGNSDTIVKGPNQDNKAINKIFSYLTPPGQTPPTVEVADTDNVAPPIAGVPPSVPPGPNTAFTIPACDGVVSNFITIPTKSAYVQGVVDAAAASEGVPASLLSAILYIESGGDKFSATGPDATCTKSVCGAFGWFQILCGAENVTCPNCSDHYCCDYNNDGTKEAVCSEYVNQFACPMDPPSPDLLCDPSGGAVYAAKMLKNKIGVDSYHQWTADDACRAASLYFGEGGYCENGEAFARLGNCSYGKFAKEFVRLAGL